MERLGVLQKFEKEIPGVLGAAVGSPHETPVSVRGEEPFPAASLIKVPILIYLLREKDRGNLKLDETILLESKDKVGGSGILFELHDRIPFTLHDLAVLMIVVSDNTATNLLMDRLGADKIQTMIDSLGLSKTLLLRKMMIAGNAPPANYTSPLDMFALHKKLVLGELLSRESTDLAIGILSRQQYNEKIPLLLPKEVKVAHKTGEISGVRDDCGIVLAGNRPYILCLLTKEVTDEVKTDQILARLSLEMYNRYKQ